VNSPAASDTSEAPQTPRIPKNRQTNSQSLSVLTSWLAAAGIEYTLPLDESGVDLRVQKKDHQDAHLNVAVQVDLLASAPENIDTIVLVDEVLSLNREQAFAAFHSITEPAGYGRPVPVYRGEDPKNAQGKKIKTYDFDLLVFRHCEFRNAPNLPPEILGKYKNVMLAACRTFYRRNPKVCRRLGYELEDLMTPAMVWTHSFHHKYRNVKGSDNDNRRNLAAHLNQRFFNSLTQIHRREASALPDEQTVNICSTGDVFGEHVQKPEDACMTKTEERASRSLTNAEWLKTLTPEERKNLSPFQRLILQTIEKKEREAEEARAAKEAEPKPRLTDLLSKLPHNDMVYKLDEVTKNPSCDYEARREAGKRLELHQKDCTTCIEAKARAEDKSLFSQDEITFWLATLNMQAENAEDFMPPLPMIQANTKPKRILPPRPGPKLTAAEHLAKNPGQISVPELCAVVGFDTDFKGLNKARNILVRLHNEKKIRRLASGLYETIRVQA
jgi:hypothetical protein